ncbi:MAG: ATP-binding protein [Oligoflexales bacterium]|nr:ATP-binding protein [Oligoflexales bacterium]
MERVVNILKLLEKSSCFLFGARGTGKSYAIRSSLSHSTQLIDLLKSDTYLSLNANASQLEHMIQKKIVVIDEIQRIPELLNEVHRLIEEKKIRFLLTGSSARQLKRKGTNLLAGRALVAKLYPLTWYEISREQSFDLNKYLLLGGLPKAYLEDVGQEFLFAYVDMYLKEEIMAEALVRNLANYHRFLQAAASCNSKIINFTKIASDAQLSPNTVRDYFQILEDTLLAYMLPPFQGNKRKTVMASKFYFFDPGVRNAILNIRSVPEASDIFGENFEQFIVSELRAYLSYHNLRQPLTYWRSQTKLEVDLVVGEEHAIEIKSSEKVSPRDHKGLLAISEEANFQKLWLVSRDRVNMTFESGIQQIFWRDFLEKLWNGKVIQS